MRFLIDDCLTIDLVSVARQAGHEAQHVAHIGKAGWKDWNVARHASEGDFVLVTNNASDFRRLYATQTATPAPGLTQLTISRQHPCFGRMPWCQRRRWPVSSFLSDDPTVESAHILPGQCVDGFWLLSGVDVGMGGCIDTEF